MDLNMDNYVKCCLLVKDLFIGSKKALSSIIGALGQFRGLEILNSNSDDFVIELPTLPPVGKLIKISKSYYQSRINQLINMNKYELGESYQ